MITPEEHRRRTADRLKTIRPRLAIDRELDDRGIMTSAGSVGDRYDSALAESIIGLFKTEVIRRLGPWRPLEAVEFATLD
jgi:transposase InsO family protein